MVGNVALLRSIGAVGLSVTIPVIQGSNLAFSGLLGWLILRERPTARAIFAIGLLIVAIVLLKAVPIAPPLRSTPLRFRSRWPSPSPASPG